mgnify:CR=1 FL=1
MERGGEPPQSRGTAVTVSYGTASRGQAVAIRLDEARRVVLWRGGCVKARCGSVRRGNVWFGKAVVARCVVVRSVRCGRV